MGIGRRLVLLGCYACAMCALLLAAITATTVWTNLVISGNSLCIPKLSIRCYESDCGGYFQRCGSNAVHEIPSHKVCYRGALLSASRTDLHSCPSTIFDSNRNSTQDFKLRHGRSGHAPCPACPTCGYPVDCRCMCDTQARSIVVIGPKSYWNQNVANCCLKGNFPASASHLQTPSQQLFPTKTLQSLRREFNELVIIIGQWFLQNVAASFTFHSPSPETVLATCCPISKSCCAGNVCGGSLC